MSKKRKRGTDNLDVSRSYSNPLSMVPKAPCPVDSTKDLPYIPLKPLPAKSFCMYIVGKPGSGKTNLWLSMMSAKKPKYYRKFFDRTFLVSGSMDTLPKSTTKGKYAVPESQQFREINDEIVDNILNTLKKDDNGNNMLILDDVIKDITNSRRLSHVFLNRRHITHNEDKEGSSGLAIMIISQVYNLLPLQFRKACDHVILFKSENKKEIGFILDELMFDLEPEDAKKILDRAWRQKYGFLMIKVGMPPDQKYYDKFDLIDIESL
tara:strand:- start:1540 stop:2334 length:795 start_codon:yes stop_codon:yes gene_type:complete